MIRELIQAGFELSGQRDKRLTKGLYWAVAEGVFSAVPFLLLYLLLSQLGAQALSMKSLLIITALMVIALVLRILAGVVGMPLIFTGAYSLMGHARLRVADHLRHLPLGWYTYQRSGELGAKLTSDLEMVENLWSHFLGVFAASLAMPTFLLLFLFIMDPYLALVTTISIPCALLALFWTQKAVAKVAPRLLTANADAQSAIQEYVQGIFVIRSFGRYGQSWRKLQHILQEQHNATLEAESKPAPWLAAYGFVLECGYLALIFAALWRYSHGAFQLIDMAMFLIIALPIYRQMFEVGLSTMLMRFSRRAMARIEQLLAEPTMTKTSENQQPNGQDVVFDHVSFAYEEKTVLHELSCQIPAKKITAIVGPSGAGKSTLVHLISRLWDVNQGRILIGGTDIRSMSSETLYRQVSMVFQDVVLFSGTVINNIRLGRPDATEGEVVAAAKLAQAHEFISSLPEGYQTVLDENGGSLSGGERQRLSIARAILQDAPILLLDEATASVDPSAEAEIQQAIAQLANGRTVIVIAHRLRTIADADQILVMEKGRLVESGKHESLLQQSGLYYRLWQRQQESADWAF